MKVSKIVGDCIIVSRAWSLILLNWPLHLHWSIFERGRLVRKSRAKYQVLSFRYLQGTIWSSFSLALTLPISPKHFIHHSLPPSQYCQNPPNRRKNWNEHSHSLLVQHVFFWVLRKRDRLCEKSRGEEEEAKYEGWGERVERSHRIKWDGRKRWSWRRQNREECNYDLEWQVQISTNERVWTWIRTHTQKVCSHKKLGCRLQPQSPLVTNPLFASSLVHLILAPGQSFSLCLSPLCLKVWKEYCWLSDVNSRTSVRSARAARI